MQFKFHTWVVAVALLSGCVCCRKPVPNSCEVCVDPAFYPCGDLVARIEYPDVARSDQSITLGSGPPRKLSDGVPNEFWDLTLDEAIRLGLQNGRILKELGGRVLTSPQAVASVYDPSILMSHPRLGEEAALAAFNAQYEDSFTYSKAHQAFNNSISTGFATEVSSDGFNWISQIRKTAATGTQFSLGRLLQYENSDTPFTSFQNVYTGAIQATVRHPLLQGSGVRFNRIVGPRATADLALTRGVILARIDGDIGLARFERGVRDFVRDVETAYWQLYFAYRTLDAFRTGRDASRSTWQTVKARYTSDLRGGEADQEAQAREQLFLFEQRVLQALNGSPTGGDTGVYLAERNLRRMLGLPVSDARLIRPADEPVEVPVKFDWHDCLTDALVRRVELREQMWRVKQRELELIAAKNFLLPRLDAIASYRIDGFGNDLTGSSAPFESLVRELFSFDNNQAQVGLQFSVPLGFRRELAGVRHSKLNLCRAQAVLDAQEQLVSHNLGSAFVAVETAYESIQLNQSRLEAAEEVVEARQALLQTGKLAIEFLLESQRRLVDAQINYFQSRSDYALAIRNLHFEKGTLLPYDGIRLQEGPWPSEACQQTWYERRRWVADRCQQPTAPWPVSLGPYDNALDTTGIPTVGSGGAADPSPVASPAERLPDADPLPEPILNEPLLLETTRPRAEVPLRPVPTGDGNQPSSPLTEPLPNENPFRDEPGPGDVDPGPPGPAETSLIEAVTYMRQLLDGGAAVQPAAATSGAAATGGADGD